MDETRTGQEIDVFQDPRVNNSRRNDVKIDSFSLSLGSRTIDPTVSLPSPNNKMDNLKSWSFNTYKCTKQIIQEKLGKATRTIDIDLEIRIDKLKDLQKRYSSMLEITTKILNNFKTLVDNQKALAEQFAELGQQQPELVSEFETNANLQRLLQKQGEHLIHVLNFFCESVNTLISKTMNDTMLTIKKFENSRVEYDAYRHEMCDANKLLKSTDPNVVTKSLELKEKLQEKQRMYDQFRSDVDVKIKFLEENKNRVMHKQLVLFNNAITSYFTGNKTEMESSIKHFSLNLKNANSVSTSWLEDLNNKNLTSY